MGGRDRVLGRRAGGLLGEVGRETLVEQLHGAVRQVARSGTEAQLTAAAGIIAEARRALYLLLADGPGTPEA